MTACSHDASPFGDPICTHLRDASDPWVRYVKWYTGKGLDLERLCEACAEARGEGGHVTVGTVCEECFRRITEDVADFVGVRGSPEVRSRPEPFETSVAPLSLSTATGELTDAAPIEMASGSIWLLLEEGGGLVRLDTRTMESTPLGSVNVPAEPDHEPWCNHALRRRLHVSSRGDFAAVVNDFGHWGQVVDLRSGKTTLSLDGGEYHPETVPFSFAFVEARGRTLCIHRTAWNRLDLSDPATGALLTARQATRSTPEARPDHDLDYFHGALLLNASSTRVLDDGWVWHPVGIPVIWSVEQWLDNVWESEDGPSRLDICARSYYWNGPMTWLDDEHIAIGGIGDDDNEIVPGARIFDVSRRGRPGPTWRADWEWALEIKTFAGPEGTFFSDGKWLFSSNAAGLSRWDPLTGERTGHLPGFCPSRYHRAAREWIELREGRLVRMTIAS